MSSTGGDCACYAANLTGLPNLPLLPTRGRSVQAQLVPRVVQQCAKPFQSRVAAYQSRFSYGASRTYPRSVGSARGLQVFGVALAAGGVLLLAHARDDGPAVPPGVAILIGAGLATVLLPRAAGAIFGVLAGAWVAIASFGPEPSRSWSVATASRSWSPD